MISLVFLLIVQLPVLVLSGGIHYCEPGRPNPCQNGAICNGYNNDYSCTCVTGWKGTNCDLRDCSSGLDCRNGATCVESGTSYSCTCTVGWKGSTCENRDCTSPQYCINGGQCHEHGSSYSCTCADGYEGFNCQYIDCTSYVWCINGGTCHLSSDWMSKSCICYYGWKGDNCQDIDECTPHVKADIIFVLDASQSQDNSTFALQKEFVKDFASQFRIGPLNYRYQIAVVTYSLEPVIHFYLDTYQNDSILLDAIDDVTHEEGGPTFTGKALQVVREQILPHARSSVERYVLVLTDGMSSNLTDTRQRALELHADGVHVLAIGVGKYIRHEELLDIADGPRHVFPMFNTDALYAVLENSMSGCNDCHTLVSDVSLVMDVSANIGPTEFDTQMNAAEEIVRLSSVGPNYLQFSFTTFSDTYQAIFDFDKHSTSYEMVIDMYTHTKSNDFIFHGNASNILHRLERDGFATSKGARSTVRKVLIFITSGHFESSDSLQQDMQNIKDSNVTVVAIGAGKNVNMTSLLQIASDSTLAYVIGDDVYTDATVLFSLLTTLEYEFCSNV